MGHINYGFLKPSKEDIEKSRQAGYVFGRAKGLNPSGDWSPYYPDPEKQVNRYLDSNGCVIFGTQNACEILANFLFGEKWNKSERYTGAFANMTRSGTSPHAGAESIRKKGLIPDELMPLEGVKTYEELWDKSEAMKFVGVGKKWLKFYTFRHHWVDNDQIREAIKDSPLGVSVYAWKQKDGMYYQDENDPPTHWVVLGAIRDDHYEIYDSYPPYIKKMPLDTKFKYIKKYELVKRKLSWWDKLLSQLSTVLFG